jgi:hypothetical protein
MKAGAPRAELIKAALIFLSLLKGDAYGVALPRSGPSPASSGAGVSIGPHDCSLFLKTT